MARSITAPSVVQRSERAAARVAASIARAAAEGELRPSARGRPRRKDASAALYILTVRLTPDEHRHVQSAAATARLTMADYTRLQLVGCLRRPPRPILVDLPSAVDHIYARAIISLANSANQLARNWNRAVALIRSGESIGPEDLRVLRATTELLVKLLDEIAPQGNVVIGRLMADARSELCKSPRR